MMPRALLLLVLVALCACGSAVSTASVKTTNPPLVIKPETPVPPPESDGPWLMSFKQLGVGLTFPNHRWKPELITEDGGGTMMKADLEGTSIVIFFKAYLKPDGVSMRDVIEVQRQGVSGAPDQQVSAIEDDGDGRLTFSVDTKRDDGTPMRGRLYVVPSPTRPDGFFLIAVIGSSAEIEQYGQEVHGIVLSLKSLP